MTISTVDAFLLGWRLCRQQGQVAHAQHPRAGGAMTPYEIFAAMTMPTKEAALDMIQAEFPPMPNKPLSELSIG